MSEKSAIFDSEPILLSLESDRLIFIAPQNHDPDRHFFCSVSKTRRLLEQAPLTETKLECAITQIEELIMPIIRSLPVHSGLKITGFELARIIELIPGLKNREVPIESVEMLFNELADYAGGSPISWRYSLSAIQAALGLVSIRETMHHGGYSYVSLFEDAG